MATPAPPASSAAPASAPMGAPAAPPAAAQAAKVSLTGHVPWHESWIIRAAILAAFILFLGYTSSAYFAFESIRGVAKLAHDQTIEDTLGAYLESFKVLHSMEQELVVARLGPRYAAWQHAHPGARLGEAELRQWLAEQKLRTVGDAPTIKEAPGAPGAAGSTEAVWLDRNHLQVAGYTVEFPRGKVYADFKAAEDIRQRYQLVGVKLDEDIRPTLLRATTTILIVTFLLLLSLLLAYARRFMARIREVTQGFTVWSERDASFRFHTLYTGELRLITVQFNAMADEVEANRQRSLYLEKIASWQVIARKLAHEIKNPLTPIQMMVSQLKRRYKGDDAEFGKLLGDAQTIITEEVAGLRRMVDNFSQFARLPQPEKRQADLVLVCQHVVELQKGAYEQHAFGFSSALATAPCLVDEDLLRQVLINLLKNAAEACSETPSHINMGLRAGDGETLITVTDDGPGIPAELQQRIFEAYFTTKHTGPNPGMGLGLAVCQKIVMDHEGRMTVRSRPGETVFTIALPQRTKDKP